MVPALFETVEKMSKNRPKDYKPVNAYHPFGGSRAQAAISMGSGVGYMAGESPDDKAQPVENSQEISTEEDSEENNSE